MRGSNHTPLRPVQLHYPDVYADLIKAHAGILTQFLPGYSEGLSMEMNWHVFFGMNQSLPESMLSDKFLSMSDSAGCDDKNQKEFSWL